MSDFELRGVKFHQQVKCQCGRLLTAADAVERIEGAEIICSACHQSVLEIRIETFAEAEPWD